MAMGLIGLASLAAACGVPSDGHPRDIGAQERIELAPSANPQQEGEPGSPKIFLCCDDTRLKAVNRDVQRDAATLLRSLLDGPTDEERKRGLKLAVPLIDAKLARATQLGTLLTIDLTLPPAVGLTGDQGVLAFAELVLTASEDPRVTQVQFRVNGRARGATKGDRTQSEVPVTKDDYIDFRPIGGKDRPAAGVGQGTTTTTSTTTTTTTTTTITTTTTTAPTGGAVAGIVGGSAPATPVGTTTTIARRP